MVYKYYTYSLDTVMLNELKSINIILPNGKINPHVH